MQEARINDGSPSGGTTLTQRECRQLQDRLEGCATEESSQLFVQLLPHFVYYALEKFGNYVAQKLYELANVSQRQQILATIGTGFLKLSQNRYGTRVVQRMICLADDCSLKLQLASMMERNVLEMCLSQYSCHVIQRCLQTWDCAENAFIYEAVKANASIVCTNRWGCCVYQRCIDYLDDYNKLTMAEKINQNLFELIQDPYGNYVIQYILDMEIDLLILSTIDIVIAVQSQEEFLQLCCQKFSSNVIEKCIRVASRQQRHELIKKIIHSVNVLLEDCFGNYVLQTAVDFAEQCQKYQLYSLIDKNMNLIRDTPYGRKLFSKIHRKISEADDANKENIFNMNVLSQ